MNDNNQEIKVNIEPSEKEAKYCKHVMINYCIISAFFLALSFLSFLFNEWIVPICVGECAIFGGFVMALLIKSHSEVNTYSGKGSFAIYLILRYACMIIGIVVAALIVKFTMGSEINKMRYLIVLIAATPYFIPTISLLITKQNI